MLNMQKLNKGLGSVKNYERFSENSANSHLHFSELPVAPI
jgi:hypothetical protein